MPTDSNGNYAPPVESLATSGTTALAVQHNSLRTDVGTALTDRVMRNGSAPMSGPLKGIDGTSSAPAFTFTSEPTLGLYRSGAGAISIAGGVLAGLLPVGLGPLPWSGRVAPSLWVLAEGQQISRTTYAALWAFASQEIASGNTLWNNGNGTTTFGVPDCRGRVMAGRDSGTGRLAGASDVGQAFGAQTVALTSANNGPHLHSNSLLDSGHNHTFSGTADQTAINFGVAGGSTFIGGGFSQQNPSISGTTSTGGAGVSISNASSGSGTPFGIVQPTLTAYYIIYAGA